MAESFEDRDLAGAVFWGVDLSGARFRDVNLTNATINSAWLINVEVDALIDHVVINGVDITDYVNERDEWFPLRAMLRPPDPEGLRAAWTALEARWSETIDHVRALPEAKAHESVDGEWSFVQTIRHLVFAMDKWFTAPVLGEGFDPIGMPNSGSVDFPWPDLDAAAEPTFAEALAVRAGRATKFRDYLAAVTPADLTRTVEIFENGPNPVLECLYTVLEEEFAHNRYAVRDLARLM